MTKLIVERQHHRQRHAIFVNFVILYEYILVSILHASEVCAYKCFIFVKNLYFMYFNAKIPISAFFSITINFRRKVIRPF